MRKYGIVSGAVAALLLAAVGAYSQGGGGAQPGGQGGQNRQGQGAQQQATPTQPPGSLTGQVVSATTGEPLRKVTLTLTPRGNGGTRATATSDNSGTFRFPSVDPGNYTLTGERTGFVRGTFGETRPGGQATPITVATAKATTGIQLKLTPQSVITGRVYDQDGDPIQNAMVQVMRYSYPQGQRQLNPVAQATTNDLGEFRVANLAPGRYYVSASNRTALVAVRGAVEAALGPGGPGGPGGRGGRGALIDQLLNGGAEQNPEDYVTTYYPRSVEAGGATPLDLVPGSEMRGIDIGLLKARKFNIAGTVEGLPAPNAQPQNNQQQGKGKGKQFAGGPGGGGAILNLVPRSATNQAPLAAALLGGSGGVAQVNADGTFEFRGVQPGAYYIMAQGGGRGPQQGRLSARVPVDVGSGDIRGLNIRLTPPLEVTGKIAPEKADSSLNLANVRVNFVSNSPAGRGGQPRIQIGADGKFTTQLDADTYTVEVQGAPSGYYLKAVKLASREVPDNVLDLTTNGSALDLVLANDAGSITGKVERSNSEPAQGARVTAVPANGSNRRDLYKTVNTGADGTFTLSTLPPGSYKIYAWEEVEQNAWMDPDFRRPFESLGTNATVRDGAGPNVTLRLIERDQIAAAQ